MEYDVFISYANGNRAVAEEAVSRLENQGLKCWIAPRNIGTSQDWPVEIARGIERSRSLVVVFSAESDTSQYVQNEVKLALGSHLPIIPLRIEDVPARGLRFYLANRRWVDGTCAPDQYWDKLVAEVKATLKDLSGPGTTPRGPDHEGAVRNEGPATASVVVATARAQDASQPRLAGDWGAGAAPGEHRIAQDMEPERQPVGAAPEAGPSRVDDPGFSVFISYRRDDSAPYAVLLHDRLTRHFAASQVFMDIDAIPLGVDFSVVLTEAVGRCDVLLALIGRSWLASTGGSGGRRLDDPADFVRLEIAAALERNIKVIPVLVGGARMPCGDDLPKSLRPLAHRNGIEIHDGRSLKADVERLAAAVKDLARGRC